MYQEMRLKMTKIIEESLEIYKNCKSTYELPYISIEQLKLIKNELCTETTQITFKEDYIGMNAKLVCIDFILNKLQKDD